MASGFSRIRIFNPTGNLISEFDAPTKRSWVLNNIGRCQFTVPVYDTTGGINPKCVIDTLGYGKLVLIDHKPSQNADLSFNGLLPPWVGIILPPQSWEYGKLTVTAYSAEQILQYRALGLSNYFSGLSGGGLFAQILQYANSHGGLPIQPGNVDQSGKHITAILSGNALQMAQQIATYTGNDFDITPEVSAGNQLILRANWYLKKGINTGVVLSNSNLVNTSPIYTEQGTFYNSIWGSSDASTPGARVYANARDEASIALNGLLEITQVFPGTAGAAVDVIQDLANKFLAANNKPVRTFAPTVLDIDNAFSFCNTGNTFIVQNDTAGFQNGGVGINGTIRVTSMEYSELTNNVKLAGTLQ